MELLDRPFLERIGEITTYLDLLAEFELQIQNGPPKVGNGPVISATQQRILYSSVYLQLYNLVESTITKCLEAVCFAISSGGRWRPSDLSAELRREWVRHLARTHTDLNYEHRLDSSLQMCGHLIEALPVGKMEIEKGGGNWNDQEIYRFANRLGCHLHISASVNEAVKKPFRDERGALSLIMQLRNDLAHGSVSFGECGAGVTVNDLRELNEKTVQYLSEVVASFKQFIETYSFLQPSSRPSEVLA